MEHFRGFLANLTGVRDKAKEAGAAFNEFSWCYWTLCDGLQEFETESVAEYLRVPADLRSHQTYNLHQAFRDHPLLKVERQEIDAIAEQPRGLMNAT
jgi:hypothetical protein